MAKQLYDYWFVQFDFPNEEGKPYKSSGGVMVWNERIKREVPVGWQVENIIDFYCCPLKVSEQRDIHPQCCCNGIADDFSEGKPLS